MDTEKVEQLKQFILKVSQQPSKSLKGEDKLISSGLIDSFNMLDLALFVEDVFKVKIEDTELSSYIFDTLDELLSLINKKMNK